MLLESARQALIYKYKDNKLSWTTQLSQKINLSLQGESRQGFCSVMCNMATRSEPVLDGLAPPKYEWLSIIFLLHETVFITFIPVATDHGYIWCPSRGSYTPLVGHVFATRDGGHKSLGCP